jgi:hypothetical protein
MTAGAGGEDDAAAATDAAAPAQWALPQLALLALPLLIALIGGIVVFDDRDERN